MNRVAAEGGFTNLEVGLQKTPPGVRAPYVAQCRAAESCCLCRHHLSTVVLSCLCQHDRHAACSKLLSYTDFA